jgi:hypothetical protein
MIPIYPLLAFVAAVLVSVLLTIGQTRYRAPAEVSLVLLAALALDRMWDAWRGRGRRLGALDVDEPAGTLAVAQSVPNAR